MCTACHPACLLCTGGATTSCSRCASAPSVYYLDESKNECTQTCPDGTWNNPSGHPISTDGYCTACSAPCKFCSTSGTVCTTCVTGFFYQPAANPNKCLSDCPVGFWGNPTTNACEGCNSMCASCTGPLASNCQSCNTNFYLIRSASTCTINCPDGTHEVGGGV